MKLVFASNNAHKLEEVRKILSNIEVVALREIGFFEEIDETGNTLEQNSHLKAQTIWDWLVSKQLDTQYDGVFADDTGLEIDALGGAPGVYSARFGGEHGNDAKNNEKLLGLLKDVADEERTARFVSCVCCCFPDGRSFTVRGTCEGVIAHEVQGNGGFGYDPVFLVGDKTFGELSAEEKDKVSHRGNALRKFVEELPKYLGE